VWFIKTESLRKFKQQDIVSSVELGVCPMIFLFKWPEILNSAQGIFGYSKTVLVGDDDIRV